MKDRIIQYIKMIERSIKIKEKTKNKLNLECANCIGEIEKYMIHYISNFFNTKKTIIDDFSSIYVIDGNETGIGFIGTKDDDPTVLYFKCYSNLFNINRNNFKIFDEFLVVLKESICTDILIINLNINKELKKEFNEWRNRNGLL